ncbi:MAG: hypothetical protein QOF40_3116 [Actinomycetota bacterium]|nr:hypothetical protein [Actinomycetota bacterium]
MDRSQASRPHAVPRIAAAILGVSGAWFLLTRSSELLAAVGSVASLGPEILPIGLGLVALGVLTRGIQARQGFRLVGIPTALVPMVELSASSYATNKVVKACGAAGLVPFLAEGRRRGHNRAKVIAGYMSVKLAETISLCLLIAVVVVASIATGALHGAVLYGALASLAYALVVSVALAVVASSRSAADATEKLARRVTARIRALLHRPAAEPGPSAGHELVDAVTRLRSDPISGMPLLVSAVVGKVVGGACLALVLFGFGTGIGLPTIALFYTLTLMAAMIGPLPGGIGVAEASLGALLVARGVPAPTAAAAVIAFRLLDLWLPLLAGVLGGLAHSRRAAVERPAAALEVEPSPVPALA